MKRTLTTVVLLVLALGLGYNLGHRSGVQEEQRAWLATEQRVTDAPPVLSVDADGRVRQRPHMATRTFYTDPHSGKMVFAGGDAWVNTADPRTLQEHGAASP